LPPDLQALASCEAIRLSNSQWHDDMKRLLEAIETSFAVFAGVRKPLRVSP
jgi:hypothetical protein